MGRDLIRADLQTQITDIFPSVGTVIVVHPKNQVQFSPEYSKWLAETLQAILPQGVKGLILPENVTQFHTMTPRSDSESYMEGWMDAIKEMASLEK